MLQTVLYAQIFTWGPGLIKLPLACHFISATSDTHQQLIMSSDIALGHPGGGGRRYPLSTSFSAFGNGYVL